MLGVQVSSSKEDLIAHENVISFTTENLTGNNFIVPIYLLDFNTTYYYCAYVYLNGVYHYGLIREFKTLDLNYENGYAYVDLGLPSGLKWAVCNVGADSFNKKGDFFAWGEVETKDRSLYGEWEEGYKWGTGSSSNGCESLKKYNLDKEYGRIDNKTVLELADDAAAVNMGGNWRMPTKDEMQELIDECSWKKVNKDGIKGYEVNSKTNDLSIFLPATDCLYIYLSWSSSVGYYWSSSLDTSYKSSYANLLCSDAEIELDCFPRVRGCNVRGVFK